MEFKKMKNEFFDKIKKVKVAFTGLNHEEKEVLSAMTDLKIKTYLFEDCNQLVYGSEIEGNPKFNLAKKNNVSMLSLNEFKKKYMFSHEYGNFLEDKNIGVSLCFPDVEAVYLMNPKNVYFVNSINKKRALSLDYFFSETSKISDLHEKLNSWLQYNKEVKIILSQDDLMCV